MSHDESLIFDAFFAVMIKMKHVTANDKNGKNPSAMIFQVQS